MPSMRRNTLSSGRSLALSLVLAALVPSIGSALSTTNSDNAALVLADMALSRGDCKGGTERYLKAALATSDATISERANKVASECQQIGASMKSARRWQKLDPASAGASAAPWRNELLASYGRPMSRGGGRGKGRSGSG